VIALIVFVVFRFRRRDARLPHQRREHPARGDVHSGAAAHRRRLFGITFCPVRSIDAKEPDPDLTVAVTGFQWQWQSTTPDGPHHQHR
jgi:heme/copper-type cytochrome/quinol oxidase subunit 2